MADFYETERSDHVDAGLRIGSSDAVLFEAQHEPGDWSLPGTSDLRILWLEAPSLRASFDCGAGRFGGVVHRAEGIIVAPDADAAIVTRGPDRIRALSLPWSSMRDLAGTSCDLLPVGGDFGLLHAGKLSNALVADLLAQIWRASHERAAYSRLRIDALFLQLLALLMELNGSDQAGALSAAEWRDWRVQRAIDYLEARITDDIAMTDVAANVGLGANQLTSLFKTAFGETPHRWLMRRRFERACELLRDGRLSITEIAHRCGFASSQHLAISFNRRLGITPRDFRKAARS